MFESRSTNVLSEISSTVESLNSQIKVLNEEIFSLKHELMKKDHLCDMLNHFLEKTKENVTFFADQNRFLNRDKCTLERLLEESRVEIENLKAKINEPTNGE